MLPTHKEPVRAIQFINISHPEAKRSASKHRTTIRSHAARVTHSVARQIRTRAYQDAIAKAATIQHQIQQETRRSEEDRTETERRSQLQVTTSHQAPDNVWLGGTDPDSAVVAVTSPLVSVPGSEWRDPFTSSATPLTTIEHFLLMHYVTAIIPKLSTYCSKLTALGQAYFDKMIREWIRLALDNGIFLNGILLSASRHLSRIHAEQSDQQELFANMAVRFKLACVRVVSQAISPSSSSETQAVAKKEKRDSKTFSDSLVAVTIVLAFDEILLGDLAMSRSHVQGAVRMVELNGGPQTLGMNGFLEMVLHKYVGDVGLLGDGPGGAQSPPCGSAFAP